MGNKKKWTWHISDLIILLLMVLSFVLFLITLVTEINTLMDISNLTLMFVVIVTVSIVPALGKALYAWMIADKEKDETKQVRLREKRTKTFIIISVVLIIVFSVHLGEIYLSS